MEQLQIKGKWENLDGAISDSIKSVEFGLSRADSVFTDIRMEQINNATPGTAANSAIFNKTSTHGFMNAFLPDNLPTSYYFDLNKDFAIGEWEILFGDITAGPIDINDQVDIVDVFRPSKEVYAIAEDAVKIGAKVLWLQLGIRDEKAKELMEKNDIKYIENKCTKMEYQKYFLKVRQAFPVLSD